MAEPSTAATHSLGTAEPKADRALPAERRGTEELRAIFLSAASTLTTLRKAVVLRRELEAAEVPLTPLA
jgi:hypothetical protein